MRPKIGLALGSGGARGWTQIGVIEALESFGIVPDVVCGTSIGALVGAAYVTGKLVALKTKVESFGRREVAAMFDIHLSSGGLIEGRRIESFLEELGISGNIESLKDSIRRRGDRASLGTRDLVSERADRARGARFRQHPRYSQPCKP